MTKKNISPTLINSLRNSTFFEIRITFKELVKHAALNIQDVIRPSEVVLNSKETRRKLYYKKIYTYEMHFS